MECDLQLAKGRMLHEELKARISKEYSSLEGRTVEGRAGGGAAAGAESNGTGRHPNTTQTKLADLTSQLARETQQSGRSREVTVDARVSENTLVRLINKIIIEAHAQGSSDIHIEANAGNSVTRVRFRKDGELEDYLELPQGYSNALVSRIKVMAEWRRNSGRGVSSPRYCSLPPACGQASRSFPARSSELMGGKLVSNCMSTILPRTDTIVPTVAGAAVESGMRFSDEASTAGRILVANGRLCT